MSKEDIPESLPKHQREKIRRRDGMKCRFPTYKGGRIHYCKNEYNLEVHHIVPRRWSRVYAPRWNTHEATNLILLCKQCHRRIHPDLEWAYANYHKLDKTTFTTMIEERDRKVEKGECYWETKWDSKMSLVAHRRTAKMKR